MVCNTAPPRHTVRDNAEMLSAITVSVISGTVRDAALSTNSRLSASLQPPFPVVMADNPQ